MSETPSTVSGTSDPKPIIVVSGAGGVVGKHLLRAAADAGFELRVLTRNRHRYLTEVSPELPPGERLDATEGLAGVVEWIPSEAAAGSLSAIETITEALDGAAAVANLAGASIGDGRLDAPHRHRVMQSRLDSTNALVNAWREAYDPPAVFIQASAVGYYGNVGDETVDEEHGPGELFLSEVCQRWEGAARELEGPEGPRLVIGRIAMVVAEDSPGFEKMLTPIRFGVGGPLAGGDGWWPWIHADDLGRAIVWAIENPEAEGVYNFCAPDPLRQKDFTKQIAARLGRPSFVPTPAFALRIALGRVADELILPSCRAIPARLEAEGFEFSHATLRSALDECL